MCARDGGVRKRERFSCERAGNGDLSDLETLDSLFLSSSLSLSLSLADFVIESFLLLESERVFEIDASRTFIVYSRFSTGRACDFRRFRWSSFRLF